MPAAKRRLEQSILDYLDTKAKNSKVTELKTSKPYATIEELSKNLASPVPEIVILLKDLHSQNRVKVFPSSKGTRALYGSIILPTISEDASSATDAKANFRRIYGREITAKLLVPIRYA